jgi:hypothetical protein
MTWIPFKPSVHGWPFENIKSGPEDSFTHCGGMCFSALDYYFLRRSLPSYGQSLRDRIRARQRDSLSWDAMWAKVSNWTVRSESDGPLGIDGLTRMTLRNEWPRIRAKLDSREPVVLCLIRGAGLDDVFDNHQVVATRYESGPTSGFHRINIYDSNFPGNDDCFVEFRSTNSDLKSLDARQVNGGYGDSARPRGFFMVEYDRTVNMHLHRLGSDGRIGGRVDQRAWSSGWTSAQTYNVGGKNFLFLLKLGSGTVHVHEIDADGSIGKMIQESDWTAGWSSARAVHVGGVPYLVAMKAVGAANDGDNVHVRRIEPNGSIGEKVDGEDRGSGWTDLEAFEVGGKSFLIFLRTQDGRLHVRELTAGGQLGPKVDSKDWTSGWTSIATYPSSAGPHLVLLKAQGDADDGKNVHVHPLMSNGKIGPKKWSYGWSAGWTLVRTYNAGDRAFLFLLKASDGTVHLNAINSNGSIGAKFASYDWSRGWTAAETFTQSGTSYLVLLKQDQTVGELMKDMMAIGMQVLEEAVKA